MSFGFSTGDVLLLVQLAWTTVQNSRKACGEHAELTCEMISMHINLQRLQQEIAKVESPINRPSDTCRQDLAPIVNGCRRTLDVLNRILEKYNALSDGERSKGKLWKAVRFGNGQLANVQDLRSKLIYYTGNLSLFLNMVSMGSMGIIEKQMCEAGGDLKEIRRAVNEITAHFMTGANKEGSVLTDYADDDKAVWRAFRRELIKEGFSSDVIREHKDTIQAYVKELGRSGILDDEDLENSGKVSEHIVDTEPTQATPQSRDEAIGSFESKAGSVRDSLSPPTAITAHVDNLSGTGKRDRRENGTIFEKTPTAPAPSTMNNVSDTLPSTTQADTKDSTVVESEKGEAEEVDDSTEWQRSSTPIPSAQHFARLAGADSTGLWNFRFTFRYYKYDYCDRKFLFDSSARIKEEFELLSNPLSAWGKTLWFHAVKGFQELVEFRVQLQNRGPRSKLERLVLLKVSPLLDIANDVAWEMSFLIKHSGRQARVLYDLMDYGRFCIDSDPKKWKVTKWPLPPENTESEGHADGDTSKRSTSTTFSTERGKAHPPPAASAAENGTRDQSSTTEESETDADEIDHTSDDSWSEDDKRFWQGLTNKAKWMILEKRRRRQELEEKDARSTKKEKMANWLGLGLGHQAKLRKSPTRSMEPPPYKMPTSLSASIPYPSFPRYRTPPYRTASHTARYE